MLELLTVEYIDKFHQTMQTKLPSQILERSMDLRTYAVDLEYVNYAACISSNKFFERM